MGDPQPADVLLFQGRSFYSFCIRWAQGCPLTHSDRLYAPYTHAALIVEPGAHGDHLIVEATGHGVRVRRLGAADMNPAPVRAPIEATPEHRQRAVTWALTQVKDRYDWAGIASVGVTLLSGCDLVLSRDGTWFCSQLCVEALIRAGLEPPRCAAHMSPSDLASWLKAPIP